LKIGAKPETAGAAAHASGAGILKAGAAMENGGASGVPIGAEDFRFGATRLARTLAPSKFGAVVVKTGAMAEKPGQSSKRIQPRRRQAGLGDRNRGRGCAISETSDCSPVLHALLMGCFTNRTRASIFICIFLTAIFASSAHFRGRTIPTIHHIRPSSTPHPFSAILRLD
jgi:hypothetical protein